MAIVNQDLEFFEENRVCSYFENESSDIRYQYLNFCSIDDYQQRLERGWRRFGKLHFVPECKNCTKCISMRIDVKKYKFSKSDRRVFSKILNKNVQLYIRKPTLTIEHLHLYDRYHKFMHTKKNWPYHCINADDYITSYVEGSDEYAKEFLYMKDGKLIGVSLVDILPKSISAIYCYYDHKHADLSIGKYSILLQIMMAKKSNIPYVYLGYWIKNHYSMGYKEMYQPFEILKNRADFNEEPIWERYTN